MFQAGFESFLLAPTVSDPLGLRLVVRRRAAWNFLLGFCAVSGLIGIFWWRG